MIRCARVSAINALFLALIACGVFAALPTDATAQSVSGTLLGTVTDVERRGRGGRQNHRRQRRHRPDAHRHLRRQRRLRRPVDSDRAIYGDGRSGRVQDARALEHRARRRPAGADRSQARSRRAHRVGHHRSRQSAPPDLVVRAGDDGQDRAAPGDAAQRPQFREPHALGPGRPAWHSRRQHRRRRQPGMASLGIVLRQRSTRARQQLHARRRRQQRDLAADGRHFPQRRCARRVQTADVHLLGGIRPFARRRRQPADQVGHQHAARQRLRVPPQRRVRRQQLLQQPCGAGQADVRTEPVRRDPRRRVVPRQDVLLRRISGASGESGTHVPVDGAVRGHAFGQLLRVDPRHLRSDRPGSRSRATSFPATGSIPSPATSSRSSIPNRTSRARAMRARDRRSTIT